MPPLRLGRQILNSPKEVIKNIVTSISERRYQDCTEKKYVPISKDTLSRRNVMARQLALQCLKCPAARNTISCMKQELVEILSSQSTADDFVRFCSAQCLQLVIFDHFSSTRSQIEIGVDLILQEMIDCNIIYSLVNVMSSAVERVTNESYCEDDTSKLQQHALIRSNCMALNVIFAKARDCSVDTKIHLFRHLQTQQIIFAISKWVSLDCDHSSTMTPLILPIIRTGIAILRTLCEMIIEESNIELSNYWIEAIKHHNLVMELIKIHSIGNGSQSLNLSCDIIESLLVCATMNNSITSMSSILKSISAYTKQKMMDEHDLSQVSVRELEHLDLYRHLALFTCGIIFENQKERKLGRRNSKQKDNKSLGRTTRNLTAANRNSMGKYKAKRCEHIITLTWAIIHRNHKISEVANLAMRELFPRDNRCTLTHTDTVHLLDLGYVHVLVIVRELCRLKKRRNKGIMSLLEEAISMTIATGKQLLTNSSLSIEGKQHDGLILEELFLMHVECCRQRKHGTDFLEYFIPKMTPWNNCEDVFLFVGNIMRIYNLGLRKNRRGLRAGLHIPERRSLSPLKNLNALRGLKVEIYCRDKMIPVVLQCPPIENIISGAPILALQVSRNIIN